MTSDRHDLLTAAIAYESLGETISQLNKEAKAAEDDRKCEKARILEAMGEAASIKLPMGYEVFRLDKKRSGYAVKPARWVQIEVDSTSSFRRSVQ